MNVPSPAPCHVAVAGVGKQSVWGLRIIACSSIITLASFRESVNSRKWRLASSFLPVSNRASEPIVLLAFLKDAAQNLVNLQQNTEKKAQEHFHYE